MPATKKILLLHDGVSGTIGADLDILYPSKVARIDIRELRPGVRQLSQYDHVVTIVDSGDNLRKLDYKAITAYAKSGGQVISCLFEYASNRDLHFSKTHVHDQFQPTMIIAAETDITAGFRLGDSVGWFGMVSSAPDQTYANQMYQRQILGVKESKNVRVLATSNVNGGTVLLEEIVGKGRIIAMDLASPYRPFYNSWGSTNKYLFLGNAISQSVKYGRHYPERLSYDQFVELMFATADAYPDIRIEPEGASSDGRQIYSLNLGDKSNPTVFLGAAIHGWEWENSYGLLRFAEIITQDPKVENLAINKLHYKIVPVQNPGGWDRFTRQNSRGVDLNRNFDCAWDSFVPRGETSIPWDYNYKGTKPASEPETRIVQGLIDRYLPICVIDFHTADYIMMLPHKGDEDFLHAIHRDIKRRLKNRYLTQKPYAGAYQQVNMDRITGFPPPQPYCISYAAERGCPAAFLIEMSGNRDNVHALVMNTDTIVEICLAAVKQCLKRLPKVDRSSV